jgi:hypothetical protein
MVDKQHGDAEVNYVLLVTAIALIVLPLLFIARFPSHYAMATTHLRIISALGGGLLGSFIAGKITATFPGVRAGGAVALAVLFYLADPPGNTLNRVVPLEETASLKGTIVPAVAGATSPETFKTETSLIRDDSNAGPGDPTVQTVAEGLQVHYFDYLGENRGAFRLLGGRITTPTTVVLSVGVPETIQATDSLVTLTADAITPQGASARLEIRKRSK